MTSTKDALAKFGLQETKSTRKQRRQSEKEFKKALRAIQKGNFKRTKELEDFILKSLIFQTGLHEEVSQMVDGIEEDILSFIIEGLQEGYFYYELVNDEMFLKWDKG